MTAVAPYLSHLGRLLQKPGALDIGAGNAASLFVTEPALARIPAAKVAGAAPPGVKPHAMAAGDMFIIGFGMAAATYLCSDAGFAFYDEGMIRTVAVAAADPGLSMGAFLPLADSGRCFTLVAIDTVIGAGESRRQQQYPAKKRHFAE